MMVCEVEADAPLKLVAPLIRNHIVKETESALAQIKGVAEGAGEQDGGPIGMGEALEQ
ncbi:MAG: hypothetical protein KGI26_02430 [Thaumarchaeota archaeon]|nr:hypothetical protein [Nitrososphaerota archaeon]